MTTHPVKDPAALRERNKVWRESKTQDYWNRLKTQNPQVIDDLGLWY
jgi:hypothetical protein